MASVHPPRVDAFLPAPAPAQPGTLPALRLLQRRLPLQHPHPLPPASAWHARLGRWVDRLLTA